jgi:hypothetical protein
MTNGSISSSIRSRVAYVVLTHKNPSQVGRLLRRLTTDRSTFLIHVDRRAGRAVDADMRRHAEGVLDVHFLRRRRCFWAGFGMVRATLGALDHVVRSGTRFDHVVLVSGQDYPLRPAREIEGFFGENLGCSFMSAAPMRDVWSDEGLWRIDKWHLVSYKRLHLTVPWQRRVPGGLAAYGGGAWMCLSIAAARYVVEFVDRNPRFVRFFEHVLHPDEIFFQTILMNSPLRNTVINDHLRYIDWSSDPGPTTLRASDFGTLVGSRSLLARKFDITVDETILDLLDAHLEGKMLASAG